MKILIVDDVMFIRKTLSDKICSLGHEVLTAVNGEEALKIVKRENIDLVLMDIVMPKLTGIETVKMMRAGGFTGKIVYLTCVSEKSRIIEAISAGASDYVIKPMNDQKLKEILSKASQG